jgi:hypothetical protein
VKSEINRDTISVLLSVEFAWIHRVGRFKDRCTGSVKSLIIMSIPFCFFLPFDSF